MFLQICNQARVQRFLLALVSVFLSEGCGFLMTDVLPLFQEHAIRTLEVPRGRHKTNLHGHPPHPEERPGPPDPLHLPECPPGRPVRRRAPHGRVAHARARPLRSVQDAWPSHRHRGLQQPRHGQRLWRIPDHHRPDPAGGGERDVRGQVRGAERHADGLQDARPEGRDAPQEHRGRLCDVDGLRAAWGLVAVRAH